MNLNYETIGINFNSKGKPDEIATPQNIADDMVTLFDYTDCNRKIWMDMYCKTGNTLEAFKENGVSKNNIAAICQTLQSQMLVCRKLYGKLLPEIEVEITVKSLEAYKITRRGQVYWVSNWQYIVKNNYQDAYNIIKFVILKEMEKTMQLEWNSDKEFQINNIIMNPPYNNDMYIDFVTLAKNIATESTVAITPAKFQAKTDGKPKNSKCLDKNEQFRKGIVPYMDKVVFYPCTEELFDIREASGIAYYIIGKDKKHERDVKVSCGRNEIINSDFEKHDEIGISLCNRRVLSIIGKVGTLGDGFKQSLYVKNTDRGEETIAGTLGFSRQTYVHEQDRGESDREPDYVEVMQGEKVVGYKKITDLYTTDKLDKYKITTSVMAGNIYLDDNGKTLGIVPCNIIGPNQVPKGSYPVLKYFDTLDECKSFKSYYESKLVSFLFYFGACGSTLTKEFYRYIPDQVKYDHIFTDAELYQKYDLTPDEITIIESVIKERK